MDSFRNLSARDKKISLYLIGILLIIVVYVFVFSPLIDKYSVMKSEQDELQREVDLMNEVNADLNNYKTKTEALKSDIEEFTEDFEVELLEEDDILFAKSLEDKTKVDISVIQLNERYFVYTMGTSGSEEQSEQGVPVPAGSTLISESLYAAPMQLQVEGSYEQIKKCLTEINEDANKKGISGVSLGYNSTTGKLFGTISMNNYFLTDPNKTYTAPTISNISVGLNDIFGTVDTDEE